MLNAGAVADHRASYNISHACGTPNFSILACQDSFFMLCCVLTAFEVKLYYHGIYDLSTVPNENGTYTI